MQTSPMTPFLAGAAHPRALTISQCEQIIRNELGDYGLAVCAAAGTLIEGWVDAVTGNVWTNRGLFSRIFSPFSMPLIFAKVQW